MVFGPERRHIATKKIDPSNKILSKTERLKRFRKLRKGERLGGETTVDALHQKSFQYRICV